jgi:hypothetical protein
MRKSILFVVLLLLPASWAFAQYGGDRGGYGRGGDGMRLSVSGCLYGDSGYLTLFDDNGNTFAVSGPQAARLGQWVGHRVAVTGRSFFDPNNPLSMSANGEDVPTLRVFRIDNVSRGNRCDYGWTGDRDRGGINIHIP